MSGAAGGTTARGGSARTARTASRVLAAMLVGAAIGAAAKAHAAGPTASVAGALGVDWSGVRAALAGRGVREAAAWVALAALLAVAGASVARAVALWRRARTAPLAPTIPASAGAPPRVQRTADPLGRRDPSDAARVEATHAPGIAGRAAALVRPLAAASATARVVARVAARTAALAAGALRGPAARGRPRAAATPRAVAPSRIRALADAGVAPGEIARRTGLARDAVTLALALSR